MTVFDSAIQLWNESIHLYYVALNMRNRTQEVLRLARLLELKLLKLEEYVNKYHMWTRKIPEKYMDKFKYKQFKPEGFFIQRGIDLDMLIAMIRRVIQHIYNIKFKVTKKVKWYKVVYAFSITTNNVTGNLRKRHVEAHMVCTLPETLLDSDEVDNVAYSLLTEFISEIGYDFMMNCVSFVFGKDVVGESRPSNEVKFYLYDYNYPGLRNEVPLVTFNPTMYDRKIPGLKAYGYATTNVNWWEYLTPITIVFSPV